MKTVELDQAAASLAEYARVAKSEPVILTEDGNPIAAILAIEDVDVEALRLGSNPQFMAVIERARARLAAEGVSPVKRYGSGWDWKSVATRRVDGVTE